VVLPWSTCAMIATLRSWEVGSVVTGSPGQEKGAEYTGGLDTPHARPGAAGEHDRTRRLTACAWDQGIATTNGTVITSAPMSMSILPETK
jgi:hypothetical protein